MKAHHVVALLCFGLSSCSSSQQLDLQQQHEQASQRLAILQELEPESEHVRFKQQLYVPPLSQSTARLRVASKARRSQSP